MTEFERILENCLSDLEHGASSVDECLARHPEHAAQLKPILLTAARLEEGRGVKPSAAFKARARARLTRHMQAHPRRRARFGFMFMRVAPALAALMLALLVTGTAYAQSALPGDPFYAWKLASEHLWRALSPDPVAADIVIANRRIEEMNALAGDPLRQAQALEGYLEAVTRLKSELDPETLERILPEIGVIEDAEQSVPTPASGATATPQPEIPGTSLPSPPETVTTPAQEIIPTIALPPLFP